MEAEVVGSTLTMERVAFVKKFIENHYRSQREAILVPIREQFRKEFKEKNPKNKSVVADQPPFQCQEDSLE
ncbi:hypothetical protein GUJ93_ZPchr0010g7263 [Zizania palustris]|uniref:Uncharacterized protein n=1 Tax=Zizania palustris TaxID=103762 RepID=A0A8J6BNX2_ZIZPA|nr:hypothetical protein GUJ93_ZPchr0010g7263 [Zizania palustris]